MTSHLDTGRKYYAARGEALDGVVLGQLHNDLLGKEKTMNKSELVKAMATSAGLSQVAAEKALEGFVEAVKGSLAQGNSVTLVGFGTFSVSERAARTGRNPQTGKSIKIAAKKVAKFKAGSQLADAVN